MDKTAARTEFDSRMMICGRETKLIRAGRGIAPLVLAGLLCSCTTTPPQPQLPCHFTDDYQTQVVYLGEQVAISRKLTAEGRETQSFFTLGRVHPEKPARASDTGDRFDEWVKGTIIRMGRSGSGRWLLVESEDYDWENHKLVTYVTAIRLATGELKSAPNLRALQPAVNDPDLSNVKLEPVEFFFERELIMRLQGRAA